METLRKVAVIAIEKGDYVRSYVNDQFREVRAVTRSGDRVNLRLANGTVLTYHWSDSVEIR